MFEDFRSGVVELCGFNISGERLISGKIQRCSYFLLVYVEDPIGSCVLIADKFT